MCHFHAQNGSFVLKNFFGTNNYYYFHLPIGPFHCTKSLKILIAHPEFWGCTICGSKMAHLNENFFRKPVNKPCFFHSCLSTSQVRHYSITIKEYWNLIGWEWFMAITWEPDFSQVCSFCRMLMNHRNFHFTQIPYKLMPWFS